MPLVSWLGGEGVVVVMGGENGWREWGGIEVYTLGVSGDGMVGVGKLVVVVVVMVVRRGEAWRRWWCWWC